MKGEVAIVCSTADPASLNIFQRLSELTSWEDHGEYRSSGHRRLIVHDERQISLHGLDARLEGMSLHPEMVVFACRHQSEKGLPWMGGHFTGEVKEGQDSPRELSAAAPFGLRSFLHNISNLAPEGFSISAEATHHGPTDMSTPSFFAEIGSSQSQWTDPSAGVAVARAILAIEADARERPVFLGFGGGHYVQRQTSLMFEADVAFGHLFSSYQIGSLDREIVEEARLKSGAGYAFIDRKSLRSEEKKKVGAILEDLGVPLLRSKEIRARFPIAMND
ncbi:MAG TPA: D-aminoacyl-tRNA deacylase [Methanotrichaceae archaeon]|nr:D-aminoacyl-tRNA deacylase [Methanotrichaceae archaeon]